MVLNRLRTSALSISTLLFLAAVTSCSQTAPSVVQEATQEASPTWHSGYDEALKMAQKDKKPILMSFYADWCGWCKRMEQTTFNNDEFLAAASGFVLAKIDGDKNKELTQKYEVRGYPTVVFLNSDGTLLGNSVGFKEASAFVPVMKEMLGKAKPSK